jgi:hypothetical protein
MVLIKDSILDLLFSGIVAQKLLWFISTIPKGPEIICTDTPQKVCNEWYSEQDF